MTRNTVIFIIFLIVVSIPFALIDYGHFPYSDGPEHGAAVRALAKNLRTRRPMLHGFQEHPTVCPSILLWRFYETIRA